IQLYGIVCRLQRRHRALGIALIARPYLIEKTREINIITLGLQLQVTSARPFLGAGGEEYLQRSIGENHRTHVATIGYQPGRLAKGLLSLQQGLAHRRQGCDLGGSGTNALVAYRLGDVLTFQHDAHALAALGGIELHVQVSGQHLEGFLIGEIDPMVARSKGEQPVQRPGIEKLPAQLRREQCRDRALAGATRSIDGNDRNLADHEAPSTETRMPARSANARKLGNEVATLAQS